MAAVSYRVLSTLVSDRRHMAREEFDEFASGAVSRLYRAALLMVGDHHQAEDLTQDVLARVYVAWPRISGDPHGYAYRVLANATSNYWRWRTRHPESQLGPAGSERSTGALDDAVVQRAEVVDALRELPPRQRAVVVLRYYLDLSEAQTAQALDVSTGTIKSQNAKALAHLREALGVELAVDGSQIDGDPPVVGASEHPTPTTNGRTS
jgi:RNA polymerase sigma-70 factor (sigma-E family)